MPAGPWILHDKAKLYMQDGTIDLDSATLKVALFTSASNVGTASVDGLASATNQVAAGSGYSTGGWTVTGAALTESAGTVKFDSNDPAWTASGGTITAKFAALYADSVTTPVADPIICHCELDTVTSVSVTDGNTLTIQLSTNGYFTTT